MVTVLVVEDILMTRRKPTTKEVELVYTYWCKKMKGIGICHRKLTDKIKRKVTSILKDYDVNDVCQAIFNYATVLAGDEYYWTYAWTLEDFIQRGFEKFYSPVCFENYGTKSYLSNPKPKPKVNTGYNDRFTQWKKADADERKRLEEEWRNG